MFRKRYAGKWSTFYMDNMFEELKDLDDILKAYDVYRYCMYMPTKEKYELKIKQWLQDENTKVYAYLEKEKVKGVIVILLQSDQRAEIIGISVSACCRGQGIGSYMIHQIKDKYSLVEIYAETDDDAVKFYEKSGFWITKHVATYSGQSVIRYKCVLR